MTHSNTPAPAGEKRHVAVSDWPKPKITNPDIANPTGIPYLDCLLHRLLDAQQDINLAANEHMDQPLCDASALIDEVETCIRKFAAIAAEPGEAVAKAVDGDIIVEAVDDRICLILCSDGDGLTAIFDNERAAELRDKLTAAIAEAKDWQRLDDALVSCAALIRALASDDVAKVAAAELDYVRAALAHPLPLNEEVEREIQIEALVHGKNLLLIADAIEAERFASLVPHECARQLRAADAYLVSGSRLRAGAQEGWRPIETAPDEGIILGWVPNGLGPTIVHIGYHDGEKRFYDSDAFIEHSNYVRLYPAYWMPLPAPSPEEGGRS